MAIALCSDIYDSIIDYLGNNNLILLADTCKTLRKYKFLFGMKMNKHFSNLYYYDPVFRQQVTDHINKIKKEYLYNEILLTLDLYKSLEIETVNNPFDNIYSVNLSYSHNIKDVSALKNIHNVDLSYCIALEDISVLYNVHTLNLSGCKYCVGINKLINVHELNISFCRYVTCDDLKYLLNVEILTLTGCSQIKTITMLPPKLTHLFSSCSNITDMHHIDSDKCSNLITLYMPGSQIIDISNFSNIKYLDLSWCYNLINISFLKNVITLNISHCYNITDFSCIKNMLKLIKLDACGCKQITNADLFYFSHVKHIELAHCSQITNVIALCNLHYINLSYCNNLIKRFEICWNLNC